VAPLAPSPGGRHQAAAAPGVPPAVRRPDDHLRRLDDHLRGDPFQVYRLTRSPLAVGLLSLAELVPLLLTALVGGALADALDRRMLLRATEAGLLSYTTGPLLGNVEAGLLAAIVGVPVSVVSGGLLCVAGVALVGLALPAFRRYDDRDHLRPSATTAPRREADLAAQPD
jgi:hypothetical protein